MQKSLNLTTLPESPLTHIISFLSFHEVYINLSLSCREVHKIISSSPYILKSLFQNYVGRDLSNTFNLDNHKLKEILFAHFSGNKEPINLPFFGFRGNCGADLDNVEFLFDKAFEIRETDNLVCTRVGENFEIEGMLSPDYDRVLRQKEELLMHIRASNSPFAQIIVQLLPLMGTNLESLLTMLNMSMMNTGVANDDIMQRMNTIKARNEELSIYVQGLENKYVIEVACEEMQNAIALFSSCSIYRGKFCTCPVKTLMIFASVKEKIGLNNPTVALFNDCKTPADLSKVLKENKKKLPSVYETSIGELSSVARKHNKYTEANIEHAIFSSSDCKEDVIPLFWIQFNSSETKRFELPLSNSRLLGRYVLLKLIECEDLTEEFHDEHPTTNIDLGYCGLKGTIFNL